MMIKLCKTCYQLHSLLKLFFYRKLCVEIVETHNIPVRIATQRKLVGCLMRHCYLSNFRLVDFMALLLEFVKSKALVYNSSIWNEVLVLFIVNLVVMCIIKILTIFHALLFSQWSSSLLDYKNLANKIILYISCF